MNRSIQFFIKFIISLIVTSFYSTTVLAASNVNDGGGGASGSPAITTPSDSGSPATTPATTPGNDASGATTGMPAGAKATYEDTGSSAAPSGTKFASNALSVTGTNNKSVKLVLPGAKAGLSVARLNTETGVWEIVGVVGSDGSFAASGDGTYAVLN